MMLSEDPNSRTKWLLTLCAAFAIAFLFAIGASSCMAPPPEDEEVADEETAGDEELPEYAVYTDQATDQDTDMLGLYDPDR